MTAASSPVITTYSDDRVALKAWIKAEALALGFADCVIARPDAQAEMARLEEYLKHYY